MDRRLYEAALAGNVTSLLELLLEDALILDRALVACVSDTPLHIAAILGHSDFAREILSRKPEFASGLNSEGLSPLHFAAAKGHLQIAKEILKAGSSGGHICIVRDRGGMTPLHFAAIKGHLNVLRELLQANPEAGRFRTDQGDTILHLGVKHNHFDVVQWVLEWADDEFLNMRDDNGNTALDLSLAKKHIQTVQLLLRKKGVELNVTNAPGLTALDVLLQQNPSEESNINGITEVLENAGTQNNTTSKHQKSKSNEKKHSEWLSKRWSALMVVAILIATVTFDAGLNPPGGNCKKEKSYCILFVEDSGNPTMGSDQNGIVFDYNIFLMTDTTGFLASLSIVLLLISKPPMRPTVLMRVLMVFTWVSVSSVALIFSCLISTVTPTIPYATYVPVVWLGLLHLWQLRRFLLWWLRAKGFIKKKDREHLDIEIETIEDI